MVGAVTFDTHHDQAELGWWCWPDGPRADYTIHPDGTGMKQLTRSEDGTLMLSAAYSPDGRWIVFSKGVDGNEPDLYIMNSDGSDVRRVTKSPLWDSRPAWSR